LSMSLLLLPKQWDVVFINIINDISENEHFDDLYMLYNFKSFHN
jgi:hypothetical protein